MKDDNLSKLFNYTLRREWFSAGFLKTIGVFAVKKHIADLIRKHGDFECMVVNENGRYVRLAHAEIPVEVGIDKDSKISSLRFAAPIPTRRSLSSHIAAISSLPGVSSVLVARGDHIVAEHNVDTPLAVGSAFKLTVLRVIMDIVRTGHLTWDTIVPLKDDFRSVSGGILRYWPNNSLLTLDTLVNLMIAESDNTAADVLIGIAGRGKMEAMSPRNIPFLTTREAFLLKSPDNDDVAAKWHGAGILEKRAILELLQGSPPADSDLQNITSGIEWFYTAKELWRLLDETHSHQSLQINSGPVEKLGWKQVAFKGGSELGVLSLCTFLISEDESASCVIATWNGGTQLDQERLILPFRGIVRILATSSLSSDNSAVD
ncbi:serine hydrolase [Rhizobium johnstonii]|nr:serine hydrolase [Rhizobium johnstonii]